jgi:hypothetical protein
LTASLEIAKRIISAMNTSESQLNVDLKRQLSFRDVFFLSFGGQSPLLSLLTYGAVALSLGGIFCSNNYSYRDIRRSRKWVSGS